jgi:hypothetical protein
MFGVSCVRKIRLFYSVLINTKKYSQNYPCSMNGVALLLFLRWSISAKKSL